MGNTTSTPAAAVAAAAPTPASYDHLFPKQFVGYNDAGKPVGPEGQVYKPCCVCPDTKRERDECVLREGDEEKCSEFIAKHKACLRSYGFKPQ